MTCYTFQLSSAFVGGPGVPYCTMHCTVDGPINSISTCKDGTQVVVAGRSGIVIYYIQLHSYILYMSNPLHLPRVRTEIATNSVYYDRYKNFNRIFSIFSLILTFLACLSIFSPL